MSCCNTGKCDTKVENVSSDLARAMIIQYGYDLALNKAIENLKLGVLWQQQHKDLNMDMSKLENVLKAIPDEYRKLQNVR